VTILFCDVVGSTSLGERLDPEALRRVMARYFELARAVVERHGGIVEKFIGDAVMAVFGLPTLHEDDALRAVRAAADLLAGLDGLNDELRRDRGAEIGLRIGVNTGEVLSSETAGTGGQGMVTGDAVNVAARLEQAARAGEILIGRETHRLVRDAVDVEAVEPLALKGKGEAVPAFRLIGVKATGEGFARRLDSPIVGRHHEQRLLAEAFARCVRERACNLVTVLGSPGVGKSRLAEEFIRSARSDATVLRGRCLPYGEGITYWPVAEIIHEAAGILDGDDPDTARDRIATLVEGTADAGVITERLAQIAGLSDTAASTTELFWALRRLLETLARRTPLVVQLDDIHWAEPTLLDLIEHVADWSREAPILMFCLARPELLDRRPTCGGGKLNATSLLLEPLTATESEELVVNLLGRAELSPSAREQVVRAAEGNPLFVEQMLSMLIDEGLLVHDGGRWVAAGDLSAVSVPPTIHALLAARLDRLQGDERSVIEGASVVGKIFYTGAVAALAPEPVRSQVSGHLMTLTRKELIRPDHSDVIGEDAFRFLHMLIRDAAYESMPKQTRAELHQRFAEWLELISGSRVQEFEEILGYHLEQAYRYRAELGPVDDRGRELAAAAARHLGSSGRRAMNRGDANACVRLLERAIELMPDRSLERLELTMLLSIELAELGEWQRAERLLDEAVPAASAIGDRRLEWWARAELAHVRTHVESQNADEAHRVARQAIVVLEEEGDHFASARAWFGLSEVFNIWGQQARSVEALERAVDHAQRAGQIRLVIEMLGQLGGRMYFSLTPPEVGIARVEEVLATVQGHRLAEANAWRTIGRFRALQGRFDEARELVGRSLAVAEEMGQTLMVAAIRGFSSSVVEWFAGDLPAAERELRACVDALQRMGEQAVASTAVGVLGSVLYLQGRYDEAMEAAHLSEQWTAPDDLASLITYRYVRAEVLARWGRFDEALGLAEEAAHMAEASDFGWRGDVLLAVSEVYRLAGRTEDGTAAARRSLEMYEEKGNLPGQGWARGMMERIAAGQP
jgi:class 3 adenylate cyclase/tetratricopeptide (TPR) repeat protein